jgi:hypothetical protein
MSVEPGSGTAGAFGPWRGSPALSAFTIIYRRVSLAATETDPATPQVTNGYDELSQTLLLEAYFRFP